MMKPALTRQRKLNKEPKSSNSQTPDVQGAMKEEAVPDAGVPLFMQRPSLSTSSIPLNIHRQPLEEEEVEETAQTKTDVPQIQRQNIEEEEEDLIQTKLTIGQPDDEYEQEADRVADEAMRMQETGGLQKSDPFKTAPTKENVGLSNNRVPQQLEMAINSMKGKGSPLPEATRNFFEPYFGNLSHVSIHTDGDAVRSTIELNAKAFTIGNNIMFGAGQYSHESEPGRQLLAHELTHVLQQDAQSGMGNPRVMCRYYEYKGFSFEMGEEGRIRVKKDDWLSKYAAAMYEGDMSEERINEFVRLREPSTRIDDIDISDLENATMPIEKISLIKEGEDIYHKKTLEKYLAREKAASEPSKPLPPVPEGIPSEEYRPPPDGSGSPGPGPLKKPEEWEKPYERSPILRGEPQPKTPGQRYQERLEEEEKRKGSPDLPGTRKGEVDPRELKEKLEEWGLWPF